LINENEDFVDHYAMLEVLPTADSSTIEHVFRHLAKRFHPDHPETADPIRFDAIIAAHNVLKNRDRRADYDRLYAQHSGAQHPEAAETAPGKPKFVQNSGVGNDAGAQANILLSLYYKRRENAHKPGISAPHLQRMAGCSLEHMDFHIWYMKEKGLIHRTDEGLWAITVVGIDQVMTEHQRKTTEMRLIAHTADA
jgi:curved DNA-binding protein